MRTPNYALFTNRDFYIFGKIGSGKDVVTNFLRSYYSNLIDYKISGTIKQIITEKYGITPITLENRKRLEEEIRNKHYEVSEYLGEESSLNRIKLLVNKNALDQQYIKSEFDHNMYNIIINDFRTKNELLTLFGELKDKPKNKPVLFVLLRNFDKKQTNHYTEEYFDILEFIEKCDKEFDLQNKLDIIFIHNQDDKDKNQELIKKCYETPYISCVVNGDKKYNGIVEQIHLISELEQIIKNL